MVGRALRGLRDRWPATFNPDPGARALKPALMAKDRCAISALSAADLLAAIPGALKRSVRRGPRPGRQADALLQEGSDAVDARAHLPLRERRGSAGGGVAWRRGPGFVPR